MPRPCKERLVGDAPVIDLFKPAGMATRDLETITLGLDELEALRLADVEGLYQAEAAEHMAVSRATFGRLVSEARSKVARALTKGCALAINGGPVRYGVRRPWRCETCGATFEVDCQRREPATCPSCTAPVTCCGGARRRLDER